MSRARFKCRRFREPPLQCFGFCRLEVQVAWTFRRQNAFIFILDCSTKRKLRDGEKPQTELVLSVRVQDRPLRNMISSLQKDSVEIVEKKALMFVLTRGHALRVLSGKRFYKAIFLW